MGVIGYKCNRHDIEKGTFAQVLLRRMVEANTGEVSDAEYKLAVRSAADKLGLKFTDDKINLKHMSVRTLSYISNYIAEEVIAGRPQKVVAI